MKKNISNIIIFAGLTALTFTACSEPDDEITSNSYSRNFSPVNLEARVVNQTQIRVNWTPSEGATAYKLEVYNDSMQFAGSPVKTATVMASELPYTMKGFEGEEYYSIRVQAVTDGNESRTSKWTSVTVQTSREQIFKDMAEADLSYTSVTLRWPAGESADYITITPGDIRHNLTADEIAAGAATIDGLDDDTDYTATMIRGSKTRGTAKFTTPLNLNGATKIEAGSDIAAAIAAAADGDVLALMPGEYPVAAGEEATYENGSITINKSITIRSAKSSKRATILGRFAIEGGASLTVNQLVINTSKTDGGQVFNFTAEGSYDHLIVQDCEIIGKQGQKGFYYVNLAAAINEITINNCFIRDIECNGGDFFDCRKGYIKAFTMTNSTVWNCANSRDLFRMDDASSSFEGVDGPKYVVDHCTFVDCGNGGANYRFFYLRFPGNTITFTNSIVVGFSNKRGFANNSATDQNPTLAGNYYWNTINLLTLADGNTEKPSWFDTEGKEADPKFADAANGNFTVGNEDIKFYGIGDPRWLK